MDKISRYEIREQLGRGGMGAVYRAHDPVMEREVAIKVILDLALDVPEIKERFYREARTAGKLTHENITIIHDVGEDQGRPFIVMEYLTGSDLRTLLERHEPMSMEQRIDYAIQICRGLAYSHAKDIIHRDVKPANIRILEDGRVKIMDFGIARLASSSLTSTGTILGTPYYMSPEQIQGNKVDRRADIFSCGVVLFELFTSQKPFRGQEPTSVMYKIVHEEPSDFDELQRQLPGTLPGVLGKMLKKNPDERYGSMDEVVDALETVQSDIRSDDGRKAADVRRKVEKILTDARSSIQKQRFEEAYEILAKATAIDPRDSQILRVREEIGKAEEEARKRADRELRVKAAKNHIAEKRFDDAIAIIQQVLAEAPDFPGAAKLLGTARNGRVETRLTEARTLFKLGAIDGAQVIVRDILIEVPGHAAAAELLGQIQSQRKAPAGNRESAETLIGKDTPPPVLPHPPLKSRTRNRAVLYAVGAGIAVVAAGILIMRAQSPPLGTVSLNVLPWAEVSKIEREKEGPVALKEAYVTPCRLSLPPGSYTVTCSNPDFSRSLIFVLRIAQDSLSEVTYELPGYDANKIASQF